jgi:hypothetical protein
MPAKAAPVKVKQSASNALGDPTQTLQTFNPIDLQQYTKEKPTPQPPAKTFIFSTSAAMTCTTSSSMSCRA